MTFPESTPSRPMLIWESLKPLYDQLLEQDLDQQNIAAWLSSWSSLREMVMEYYNHLYVDTTLNTADLDAEKRYQDFLDNVYPASQAAEQRLKEKHLHSGLEVEGFEIPRRMMQAEADLFREENLPLLAEELKLGKEYDKIAGSQTVEWQGKEITVQQLFPVFQEADRSLRELAWRKASERQLQDRQAFNQLWVRCMEVRRQLAENAGRPDYRAYRWQQLLRFDYTPGDSLQFHQAIEEVVVPAAVRLQEKRRKSLGIESLRPWDLQVDPHSRPPLRPFQAAGELVEKVQTIFNAVDPQLGAHFKTMQEQSLLELENRKGKAPGGYCIDFPVHRVPFIFMNAVGIHDDVQTLLHEGGHAFHVFETSQLPYHHQLQYGMEIAEVASMTMELLAAPYLTRSQGGFYEDREAARARIEHLEQMLIFWPYMAVVDAFQHWAYENHTEASLPDNCDRQWKLLWERFIPSVDWSGLEDALETGWHRKLHIFHAPFYYIEYGLAQLGAVQIWRNALENQALAVAQYRQALSLGATRPLPDLFEAAGARFAFDAGTLREAVDLIETTIYSLEAQLE
jgi:oligoendopeptidase F